MNNNVILLYSQPNEIDTETLILYLRT